MYWTLELATYLTDAPWPANKDELIDYCIRTGAPLEVIENLQEIEEEERRKREELKGTEGSAACQCAAVLLEPNSHPSDKVLKCRGMYICQHNAYLDCLRKEENFWSECIPE